MTSKLSKLSGIKKLQGAVGASSKGRVAEARREQDIASRLDAMTPTGGIDLLIDDMRRLLYTLVKEGGWTKEDVDILATIDDPDAAKAMITTLHGALEHQGLQPMTQEAWMAMKLVMITEDEMKKQAELRQASKNAARKHMLSMVEGMAIHEGELEWAAEMMDIIAPEDRGDVRAQWNIKYNDSTVGMESDRYRNANLVLLNAAMAANPDKFKAASERKKSRHK